LFVSHNMNAIEELCQTAMLLVAGRVVAWQPNARAVVESYLAGALDSGMTHSEWTSTGDKFENEWLKPTRLAFCDEHGRVLASSPNDSPEMWLQVEIEVKRTDRALTIGYAIYSEAGTLLYWSYPTDRSSGHEPPLPLGRCTLRSKLPIRFLNEGGYRVELIGGLHFREWLFEPGGNVPTIHFHIRGGLSDSPFWMARRPGLLAPVLEWRRE
jgi:lipopolysaccharide transport system ATP-binding protein